MIFILIFMVLGCLAFLIQPVYSSGERRQNISLEDSGNPLSIVNGRRASPNLCNLSGNLSPPTRLPLIAWPQMLARAIIILYYPYNTTYVINLKLIKYLSSPGFEHGSPRPKAATLPFCYSLLTEWFLLVILGFWYFQGFSHILASAFLQYTKHECAKPERRSPM